MRSIRNDCHAGIYAGDVVLVIALLLGASSLGYVLYMQPQWEGVGETGSIPDHQWNGTSLRFQNQNGTWGNYTDLKGIQGVQGNQGSQGTQGVQGLQGLIPDHQWNGTRIRFQNQNGTWGNYTNLNNVTMWNNITVKHQWNGTRVRFQNPNGTWGNYTDLKGDTGDDGLIPLHEWIDTLIRFQNPDGSWGDYVDLKGDTGEKGEQGDPGLPEINYYPDIEIKKETGSYATVGNMTNFTFSISVMASDYDYDNVETNIYYRFDENSTWVLSFTDFVTNDFINASVYFETMTPVNKMIHWLIKAWDGRHITIREDFHMVLYP